MFFETSYRRRGLGATSEPPWFTAGFASKALWKQAGGRTTATGGGGTFTPPPGLPTLPGGGSGTAAGGSGTVTAPAADSGSGGGLLDSISPTMLLIGGGLALFMVLKK